VRGSSLSCRRCPSGCGRRPLSPRTARPWLLTRPRGRNAAGAA